MKRNARRIFSDRQCFTRTPWARNDEDTRILAGGVNNPSIYDRAAGGLAVNQLITDFGRTANLTASSEFQAQAENENANATREQVLLQVNVNYFGTLAAQAVLSSRSKSTPGSCCSTRSVCSHPTSSSRNWT